MSLFDRWIGGVATRAAENAIKAGTFDSQIEGILVEQVRKGYGEIPLTRVGFILTMAVEMIDRSSPRLEFKVAKEMAYQAYEDFRKDNLGVKFNDPQWDWSAAGARALAHEYAIQYWEPPQ